MNEKFNKNAKVEHLTKMLGRGRCPPYPYTSFLRANFPAENKFTSRRVCETRMPPATTKSKYSKNPTFWPCPTPGACEVSVCEEPIDEPTVQVYCIITQTSNIALYGTELLTEGRTDRQRDGRTIQLLDVPSGPFRPDGIKIKHATRKYGWMDGQTDRQNIEIWPLQQQGALIINLHCYQNIILENFNLTFTFNICLSFFLVQY